MKDRYKELTELIELAEKISDKTIYYDNKRVKIKIWLLSLILIFIFQIIGYMIVTSKFNFSFVDIELLLFGMIIFSTVITVIGYFYFRELKKINREYYIERNNLMMLLEMTDKLRINVIDNGYASLIERSIIEMRLGRIKFSKSY